MNLRRIVAAAAIVIAAVLAPTSAGAGTGQTGGGYPTALICSQAAGVTMSAIGGASYADPFYGTTWLAQSHVYGYLNFQGCYSGNPYGSAIHTSYATQLTVYRYVYGAGWVSCGTGADWSTGTDRSSVTALVAASSGFPCGYINYPAGLTYVTGDFTAQWNPTGHVYDPGTVVSHVTWAFYA